MNLEQYSPPIWLLKNGFKNEKNELLTFKDHLFLFDIYRDMSPVQAIKKCGQVGVSVLMNLKVFWLAKYRSITTIYTMPSDDDVWEFVKTKTDKIFQNNPELLKDITNNQTGLKQINGRFVYYKGTRSKSAPISTTADLLIHDEKDRSDLVIVEMYQSRTTASKNPMTWSLSNPSIVNVGIDLDWKESDQKEWFIRCKGCGKEQMLVWEENVDEIRGEYVCKYCNKILTDNERRVGRWIAQKPGKEISGYHISQMMAAWIPAKKLIKEKHTRGVEYFRNFILGEPYSVGDTVNFRQAVYDCWTPKPLDGGDLAMGIDIGKIKHYVIGNGTGIFKIGACETRKELESVIDHYNPTCVMDSGPERTWAEEFKQKYPKMWLCFFQYDRNQAEMFRWGGEGNSKEDLKNVGYVWADRNRAIDKVLEEIQKGEILFSLSREDLEKYIAHWETMRRIIEENVKMRTKRYVWESTTGVNHWALATLYYYMARSKVGKFEFVPEETPQKPIIEQTSEGPRMRDLKEIINEINE